MAWKISKIAGADYSVWRSSRPTPRLVVEKMHHPRVLQQNGPARSGQAAPSCLPVSESPSPSINCGIRTLERVMGMPVL